MNRNSIATFLAKGEKTLFDYPVSVQYAYMDGLKKPLNDIDRSYNQFLCGIFFVPKWKRVTWSIVSVILLPFVLVTLFIKSFFLKKESEVDAVAENKGMDEIIPIELLEQYTINRQAWDAGYCLKSKDIGYLFRYVFKYPNFYFLLKAVVKVANYSAIIHRYSPHAIIVHAEYSFCSSLMTHYCNVHDIKHINVMHGEKLRYIRDSYFHFNECFVWDQHYKDLLIRQWAEKSQFRIALPPSMKIDKERYLNTSKFADYKYYLANYTEEELANIVKTMNLLKDGDIKVMYRPHPRFSDISLLKKYVEESMIEYPCEVDILTSLSNVGCAVGVYTTVLVQAYFSHINVLIDDINFNSIYTKLEEHGYILSSKETTKISDKVKVS